MDYTDDSELPEVTDDILSDALQATKPYTIVILKTGPMFSTPGPDRDSDMAKTIWAHGKRNFALRAAGLLPIVCPVQDGSDVTGVGIFDAGPEDVERIMSNDPGVKVGIFTYDIHPTRTFPGSTLNGSETAAILVIEYRLPTDAVPDYAAWKRVFDTDPVGRKAHGATRHWIHQSHADPNRFMLSIEFPSTEAAEAFLNEPTLKHSWEISGAGQAWVVRQAESITY